MSDESDDLGDLLGSNRGATENLLILAAMAVVAVAVVAAIFWSISD